MSVTNKNKQTESIKNMKKKTDCLRELNGIKKIRQGWILFFIVCVWGIPENKSQNIFDDFLFGHFVVVVNVIKLKNIFVVFYY